MKKFVYNLDYPLMDVFQNPIEINTEFMSMLDCFRDWGKERELKIRWAYLNNFEPIPRVQFAMVSTYTGDVPDNTGDHMRYMLTCSPSSALISLQGFNLAKRDNRLNDYFKDLTSQPVIFTKAIFNDWLIHECGLSPIKTHPNYWRKNDFDTNKTLADQIESVNSSRHSRF